jgi:hypothetical protein
VVLKEAELTHLFLWVSIKEELSPYSYEVCSVKCLTLVLATSSMRLHPLLFMQFVRSACSTRSFSWIVQLNELGEVMNLSSRLTDPSETSRRASQLAGVILQTLTGILESPVLLGQIAERYPFLPRTLVSYVDFMFVLNGKKTETLSSLWNLSTLEVYQESFGANSLVLTLLESTLTELCLDTVLEPLLSDFLQTEGTLSKDGTRGWIIGSQLLTFCSQTLGGKKN